MANIKLTTSKCTVHGLVPPIQPPPPPGAETFPGSPDDATPASPALGRWCPAICFLLLRVHLSWVFYEMGSCGVWPAGLVPLGITPSRPACSAAGVSTPPLPRPGSVHPGAAPVSPSTIDGHLRASPRGCCEQSIREHVRTKVGEPACTSSGYRPRSEVAGSRGGSEFNCWRTCQAVLTL